jgi:hypothetical protein
MKILASIAVALTFIGANALAIEPPKQDKPPPSTATPPSAPEREPEAETTPPAGTQPAEAPAAEEDEETLPPLPPSAAPVGPPPQRFNPTEKVRADFPVSFPIDI